MYKTLIITLIFSILLGGISSALQIEKILVPPSIPDENSPLLMIKYHKQNLEIQDRYDFDFEFTTYHCGEIFKQVGKFMIMCNIHKFSYTNFQIHKYGIFVVPEPIGSDVNYEF